MPAAAIAADDQIDFLTHYHSGGTHTDVEDLQGFLSVKGVIHPGDDRARRQNDNADLGISPAKSRKGDGPVQSDVDHSHNRQNAPDRTSLWSGIEQCETSCSSLDMLPHMSSSA